MIDLDGTESLGEFESILHAHRYRTEAEIRDALRRMCDTVWNRERATNPPFWHIPTNVEADVDCILYDAFEELKRYRATFGLLPNRHNAQEVQAKDGER